MKKLQTNVGENWKKNDGKTIEKIRNDWKKSCKKLKISKKQKIWKKWKNRINRKN